jgi:O-antigen ligase
MEEHSRPAEALWTMDLLIAIAGIAALLWGLWLLRGGGLLAAALAVFFGGSLFGFAFWSMPAWPVPITVDRVLLGVALVQCALYRRLGQTNPHPWGKADLTLAAFVAVVLASTLAHDFSYKNSLPLAQVLFFYLMPLALYWVVRQTPLTERSGLALFAALGTFGIYLSLTAIAEWQQLWSLVHPAFIASPARPEFLGRARGPYLNPAGCGVVQTTCLCASLMLWPHVGRRGKLLLAAGAGICLLGLYGSLTRSVWMGAILALLIVVGVSLSPLWRRRLLVSAAIAVTLGGALMWDSLLAYKRDKQLDEQLTAESAKLRPVLAQVAWNMFLDRPLLGFGYGQYTKENGPYLADRSTDVPLEKVRPFIQHNIFLALLVETGAIGMGLFAMTLWLWGRDAWRLWQNRSLPLWQRQVGLVLLACFAGYLTNGMFHDVTIMPHLNVLLFLLAGTVNQLARGAEQAARREWPVPAWTAALSRA